jgi:hypothetical protein
MLNLNKNLTLNQDLNTNSFATRKKAHEKELKKRDEVAHEAYIKGKINVYLVHNEYCNNGIFTGNIGVIFITTVIIIKDNLTKAE